MEFIQFHPTAILENKSPQFLLSEALRGEGALILNSKKERFMPKYHKSAELAPRDIVSRAIYNEEKKGKAYLDLHTIKDLPKKFPTIAAYLQKNKYNYLKNPVPITPVAHFSCGGVVTDLHGKTNIKNLYAIGEVACTGLHGANRLASNSLLEAAVMSLQITKDKLAKFSYPEFNEQKFYTKFNYVQKNRSKNTSSTLNKLMIQLQKTMWEKVGIIRTKKELTSALTEFKKLSNNFPKVDSLETLKIKNMLLVCTLITKSALKRKKSLGGHFIS